MKRAALVSFAALSMLFASACGKDDGSPKSAESSAVSQSTAVSKSTGNTDAVANTTTVTVPSTTVKPATTEKKNASVTTAASTGKTLSKDEQKKVKEEMNKIIGELMGEE